MIPNSDQVRQAGFGSKLLSHRLRGFAPREHARSAFDRLSAYPIPYVEVDTRAAADGTLFLWHGPYVADERGRQRRIASTSGRDIQAFGDSEVGLVPLDTALSLFRRHAPAGQILCLDIKDYGFEAQHLALLRRHDLEERAILVSWIPQCIDALSRLGTRCPLFLSYLDLTALGWVGRSAANALAGALCRAGRFVLIGRDRAHDDLGQMRHGFQHGLVACGLDDRLVTALRASGGGVCVPTYLAGRKLLRQFHRQELRVAVFNTYSAADYRWWAAQDEVDIVFSDNAPTVCRNLE